MSELCRITSDTTTITGLPNLLNWDYSVTTDINQLEIFPGSPVNNSDAFSRIRLSLAPGQSVLCATYNIEFDDLDAPINQINVNVNVAMVVGGLFKLKHVIRTFDGFGTLLKTKTNTSVTLTGIGDLKEYQSGIIGLDSGSDARQVVIESGLVNAEDIDDGPNRQMNYWVVNDSFVHLIGAEIPSDSTESTATSSSSSPDQASSSSSAFNDAQCSAKITIDNTYVSGSSNLSDVPIVLVADGSSSNFPSEIWDGGANSAKADWGDVRFWDENYNQIPFEIAYLNNSSIGANQRAEVYVKIPTVYHNVDTDFYITWGDSTLNLLAATDTYGRNNVWTDYSAVWHFTETLSAAADHYKDSTGNNYHLTLNSVTGVSRVSSYYTNFAIQKTGNTWFTYNPASSIFGSTSANITHESLVRVDDVNKQTLNYMWSWRNSGGTLSSGYLGGSSATYDNIGLATGAGVSASDSVFDAAGDEGQWRAVVWRYASSVAGSMDMFHEDSVRHVNLTRVANGNYVDATRIDIGRRADGFWYIDATFDELRISRSADALNSDRINTIQQNMKDPFLFSSAGAATCAEDLSSFSSESSQSTLSTSTSSQSSYSTSSSSSESNPSSSSSTDSSESTATSASTATSSSSSESTATSETSPTSGSSQSSVSSQSTATSSTSSSESTATSETSLTSDTSSSSSSDSTESTATSDTSLSSLSSLSSSSDSTESTSTSSSSSDSTESTATSDTSLSSISSITSGSSSSSSDSTESTATSLTSESTQSTATSSTSSTSGADDSSSSDSSPEESSSSSESTPSSDTSLTSGSSTSSSDSSQSTPSSLTSVSSFSSESSSSQSTNTSSSSSDSTATSSSSSDSTDTSSSSSQSSASSASTPTSASSPSSEPSSSSSSPFESSSSSSSNDGEVSTSSSSSDQSTATSSSSSDSSATSATSATSESTASSPTSESSLTSDSSDLTSSSSSSPTSQTSSSSSSQSSLSSESSTPTSQTSSSSSSPTSESSSPSTATSSTSSTSSESTQSEQSDDSSSSSTKSSQSSDSESSASTGSSSSDSSTPTSTSSTSSSSTPSTSSSTSDTSTSSTDTSDSSSTVEQSSESSSSQSESSLGFTSSSSTSSSPSSSSSSEQSVSSSSSSSPEESSSSSSSPNESSSSSSSTLTSTSSSSSDTSTSQTSQTSLSSSSSSSSTESSQSVSTASTSSTSSDSSSSQSTSSSTDPSSESSQSSQSESSLGLTSSSSTSSDSSSSQTTSSSSSSDSTSSDSSASSSSASTSSSSSDQSTSSSSDQSTSSSSTSQSSLSSSSSSSDSSRSTSSSSSSPSSLSSKSSSSSSSDSTSSTSESSLSSLSSESSSSLSSLSEYCPDNAYSVLATTVRNALLDMADRAGYTRDQWRDKVLYGFADVPAWSCGRSRGNCPFIQYRIRNRFDREAIDGGSITFVIEYQVWHQVDCENAENEAQKLALSASDYIRNAVIPGTGLGPTQISAGTTTASKMMVVNCSIELEQSYSRDQYNLVPLDDLTAQGRPVSGNPIDRLHNSVFNALTSDDYAGSICDCYVGDWTDHVFQGLRDNFAGFSARNRGNTPYLEFDIDHSLEPQAFDGGLHQVRINLRVHFNTQYDQATQSENANKMLTVAVWMLDNYFANNHVNVVSMDIADAVPSNAHFYQDAEIVCEFSYEEPIELSSLSTGSSSSSG